MGAEGRYFDGEVARSQALTLELDGSGMLIATPPLMEAVSIHSVTVSSRIGNIPRTITFPSGAMFETDDHRTIDEWLRRHAIGRGWVHTLESKLKYVIGSVLFIILFVTGFAVWGIPWASTRIAYALPAEVNNYIGQGTLETLDKRVFGVSELDDARRGELIDRFLRLLPADTGPIKFSLVFRKGGAIGANAFALPDGTVIVTDELVRLAENDEQIASVMLHEIGHVEHRHTLRQVISHSSLAALTLAIFGDINSAGAMVLALPNIIMESSYSRELEWEADGYALMQMRRLGLAPEHFADFMEFLDSYALTGGRRDAGDMITECPPDAESDEESPEWLNYISTHPASSERIARFRNPPQQDL